MCFDPPLHPHPFRAGADQSAKVFVQLCSQSTSYDILSSWDVYTLFHRPDYTTVQICSPILRDRSLLDTPERFPSSFGRVPTTNADHYSYNSVIGIRRGTRT